MQLARRARKVVGNAGARRWRSPKNNTKEAARIASHDRPDPIRLNKVVSDCCCRRGAAVGGASAGRPQRTLSLLTHAPRRPPIDGSISRAASANHSLGQAKLPGPPHSAVGLCSGGAQQANVELLCWLGAQFWLVAEGRHHQRRPMRLAGLTARKQIQTHSQTLGWCCWTLRTRLGIGLCVCMRVWSCLFARLPARFQCCRLTGLDAAPANEPGLLVGRGAPRGR